MGREQEALPLLRRAAALDPLSAQVWESLGRVLVETGAQAEGRRALLERALEIAPALNTGGLFLCVSFLLDQEPEEALAAARRTKTPMYRLMGEALAQHSLGHAAESKRLLDEAIAQGATSAAFQIAEVFAWRGENDKAFEWLARARTQRDTGIGLLRSEVLLRGLHGDRRWKALLASVNLPVE